jgi:hypothetical protein
LPAQWEELDEEEPFDPQTEALPEYSIENWHINFKKD